MAARPGGRPALSRPTENMRVGLLCHRGVGGSARVAVELGAHLAARGHEVHLFARSPPFGAAPGVRLHTLEHDGGACPRLDSEWTPEDVAALVELVAGVPLDILHFHYALPFARVAVDVRARLGSAAPAIVGTLHGTDVSIFGRRRGTARRLSALLAEVDVITAVSDSHAALARRLLSLPSAPVVVPNFIDVDRFRPAPSPPRARPRIVHVSNLRRVKRPESMARIFTAVRRRADAELWLIGHGEGLPAVKEILAGEGCLDDLRAFGMRPDLETILPHTDVLLITSRTESFCLAALEAAACGVPVVAPRVGGLPEVVRDGVTGILHAPRDDEAAADIVLRLLDDAPLRRRLGAAGVARAAELSAPFVLPSWEELYAKVASERQAPTLARAAGGSQCAT